MVFEGGFEKVSKEFQECFKEASMVFQESFKGVPRKIEGCDKVL